MIANNLGFNLRPGKELLKSFTIKAVITKLG
jgi:hypothetical protein